MNVLSKVFIDVRALIMPVCVAVLRILRLDRLARVGSSTVKTLLAPWPLWPSRDNHDTIVFKALEPEYEEQKGGQSPREARSQTRSLSPCTIDEDGVPTYEALHFYQSVKPTIVDGIKFPGMDVEENGSFVDAVFDAAEATVVQTAGRVEDVVVGMVEPLLPQANEEKEVTEDDDVTAVGEKRKEINGSLPQRKRSKSQRVESQGQEKDETAGHDDHRAEVHRELDVSSALRAVAEDSMPEGLGGPANEETNTDKAVKVLGDRAQRVAAQLATVMELLEATEIDQPQPNDSADRYPDAASESPGRDAMATESTSPKVDSLVHGESTRRAPKAAHSLSMDESSGRDAVDDRRRHENQTFVNEPEPEDAVASQAPSWMQEPSFVMMTNNNDDVRSSVLPSPSEEEAPQRETAKGGQSTRSVNEEASGGLDARASRDASEQELESRQLRVTEVDRPSWVQEPSYVMTGTTKQDDFPSAKATAVRASPSSSRRARPSLSVQERDSAKGDESTKPIVRNVDEEASDGSVATASPDKSKQSQKPCPSEGDSLSWMQEPAYAVTADSVTDGSASSRKNIPNRGFALPSPSTSAFPTALGGPSFASGLAGVIGHGHEDQESTDAKVADRRAPQMPVLEEREPVLEEPSGLAVHGGDDNDVRKAPTTERQSDTSKASRLKPMDDFVRHTDGNKKINEAHQKAQRHVEWEAPRGLEVPHADDGSAHVATLRGDRAEQMVLQPAPGKKSFSSEEMTTDSETAERREDTASQEVSTQNTVDEATAEKSSRDGETNADRKSDGGLDANVTAALLLASSSRAAYDVQRLPLSRNAPEPRQLADAATSPVSPADDMPSWLREPSYATKTGSAKHAEDSSLTKAGVEESHNSHGLLSPGMVEAPQRELDSGTQGVRVQSPNHRGESMTDASTAADESNHAHASPKSCGPTPAVLSWMQEPAYVMNAATTKQTDVHAPMDNASSLHHKTKVSHDEPAKGDRSPRTQSMDTVIKPQTEPPRGLAAGHVRDESPTLQVESEPEHATMLQKPRANAPSWTQEPAYTAASSAQKDSPTATRTNHMDPFEGHGCPLTSPSVSAFTMALRGPSDVASPTAHSAFDDLLKPVKRAPEEDGVSVDRRMRYASNDTEDTESDRRLEEVDSNDEDDEKRRGDSVQLPEVGVIGKRGIVETELVSISSDDSWSSDEDPVFASVPPVLQKRVISTVFYTL